MKSIKTKLILSFLSLTFITTITIGVISINSSYTSLKEEAEKSLQLLSIDGAKVTESRMNWLLATLKVISMEKDIVNMGFEVNLNVLKEGLGKTDFLDIGYVLPNGYTHFTDGTVRLMSDRIYVQEALAGKSMISDVIISRVTRTSEIEFCVPVLKNGEVVGALLARSAADSLSNIIIDAGYGENGYAFMINGEGNLVAHPDTEKIVARFNPIKESEKDSTYTPLANAFQTMIKQKQGLVQYTEYDINYYASYTPISGTNWTYVITASEDEILAVIPRLIRTIVTTMFIVILLSFGLVYIMDLTIARPLVDITQQFKKITELDLRDNITKKYTKHKDEIGVLSVSFNALALKLREIISEISDAANHVTITSKELTEASLQTAQVSEDIASTVEEISRGATNQASNTNKGAAQAALLHDLLEKNHEYMLELNTASNNVNDIVQIGLKSIHNLSLATEDNKNATEDISKLQKDIEKAYLSMKRIESTSKTQERNVEETIERYDSIAETMKASLTATKELNQSEENMNSVINEFLIMLDSLSAIAHQNAAGTQQAASAMEEQTASSRDLADTSAKLAKLAASLEEITLIFKL